MTARLRLASAAALLLALSFGSVPGQAQPAGTGITLVIADVLPAWGTGGGWTALPADAFSPKGLTLTTEPSLTLAPGTYDVFWVQDEEHAVAPVQIGTDVVVADGAMTELAVNTGVRIRVDDWVPPLDPVHGYLQAVLADGRNAITNWTRGTDPMVLPAGDYDFYWETDDTDDHDPVLIGQAVVQAPFAGVGLELREQDGRIVVVSVVAGGAAEAAGVAPGDIIARADGTVLDGMALGDAVAVLRGGAGEALRLTIIRADAPQREVLVTRREVAFTVTIAVGGAIRAVPEPGVPALAETGGWWGIALADQGLEYLLNWAEDTDQPLLAGPWTYDVYWAQNPDEEPRLVAEDVAVGLTIVDVPIPPADTPAPATK
jgi:hypothetical protein